MVRLLRRSRRLQFVIVPAHASQVCTASCGVPPNIRHCVSLSPGLQLAFYFYYGYHLHVFSEALRRRFAVFRSHQAGTLSYGLTQVRRSLEDKHRRQQGWGGDVQRTWELLSPTDQIHTPTMSIQQYVCVAHWLNLFKDVDHYQGKVTAKATPNAFV